MELLGLQKLIETVRLLRHPHRGCPWDRAQTHDSLKPYLLEEVYEFLESLEKLGPTAPETWEELGDVLFQVVLHTELLREKNWTGLDAIAERTANKLIERHPHVFDPAFPRFQTPEEVSGAWEQIKARLRSQKTGAQETVLPMKASLQSIPRALPALQRAARLGEKAASFGFDWPNAESVLSKVEEEMTEFREALTQEKESSSQDATYEELGDLLFAITQYSRKRGWDPENLLHAANAKFSQRFETMEELAVSDQVEWGTLNSEALEEYWQRAKVRLDTL